MKNQFLQEKTNILSALENAIFEIMLLEDISKQSYENAMQIIPEYVKVLMGESVEVLYDDIGKHNGICIENKVVLNERFLKMPQTEMAKIEQVFAVLKTSTHEIMHMLDKKENASSQSQRMFIEDKANGIKTFAKLCPQKKASYELLAEALYAVDRSEVFARQGAIKTCKDFVNKFSDYVANSIQETPQKKRDYNAFCKFITLVETDNLADVPVPQIAPNSFAYIHAKIRLSKANDIVSFQETRETNTMLSAFALREKYLQRFKDDLKIYVSSALKSMPKALDEIALIGLIQTQEIDGVYDAETAQNLQMISKNRGFKYALALCENLQKTDKAQAKQDENVFSN